MNGYQGDYNKFPQYQYPGDDYWRQQFSQLQNAGMGAMPQNQFTNWTMPAVPQPPKPMGFLPSLGLLGAGFGLQAFGELLGGDPNKERKEAMQMLEGQLGKQQIDPQAFTGQAISAQLPQMQEWAKQYANRHNIDVGPVMQTMWQEFYQNMNQEVARARMQASMANLQAQLQTQGQIAGLAASFV